MENLVNKNTQKKKADIKHKETTIEFEQMIERGAGIDVHKETVVVTIQGKGLTTVTKTFPTYTASLREMKKWLKENQITHVAMESTGVYWKPVINILGEDFKILLVNARHVKNVPGHKTDKKDSQWLAKLLLAGLLKGSFIPDKTIRALRDLTRYRTKLVQQVTAAKNRFLKILEDTNIKLSCVLSDPFGVSGQRIIDVIVNNPDYKVTDLLPLVHKQVKKSKEELVRALEGQVSEHHRFMLKEILETKEHLEGKIKKLDARIDKEIAPYQKEKELLQSIPGVGEGVAIGLIAEIGVNMEQFSSPKHLASWAGMSPGNNESAGKTKSGRTTQGNKWLKSKLVEASWGATRSKETYLGNKYKSLVSRKGPQKAIIAIGHKILVSAYHILKEKVNYKDLGASYLEKLKQGKLVTFCRGELAKLEGPTISPSL
jgi:transposase